jgi:hypothetical protein
MHTFFQSHNLRMDISSPNLMLNMGSGASANDAKGSGTGKGNGKGKGSTKPTPKDAPATPRGVVKVEPTDLETWSAIGCEIYIYRGFSYQ